MSGVKARLRRLLDRIVEPAYRPMHRADRQETRDAQ